MAALTTLSIARRCIPARYLAWYLALFLAFTLTGLAGSLACTGADAPAGENTGPPPVGAPVSNPEPPSFAAGEALFNGNCALCHGQKAVGTQAGPPLIHKVYEPGHHPDFSFHNAVNKGVRAHHWPYGDMPPVLGLSPQDVENIICYVRQLQQAQGIEVRNSC